MTTPAMNRDGFGPAVDPDAALETLTAVVGGSGADEFDAFLTGRSGQYTRFAGDRIHQPQDIVEVQVMVRAVVDSAGLFMGFSPFRGGHGQAFRNRRRASNN